jgi:hypothetical protein
MALPVVRVCVVYQPSPVERAMTAAQRAALRALALKAMRAHGGGWEPFDGLAGDITDEGMAFVEGCDPATVLALLDAADAHAALRSAAVAARDALSDCVRAARPLAVRDDPWFLRADDALQALDAALKVAP